jgi:N6-L-threonylcarbamoyladenine synthase
MYVLGIETTCDETAISVVKDGFEILSHVISSQIDLHNEFGGVVPELACRRHIDIITPLLDEALKKANLTLEDIDVIAVAKGPGLIGALLIGINFAKGLAFATNKPLVGVNHVEAHLYAAMMSVSFENLEFPSLGVVLSGGHTSLVLVNQIGNYRLIGETIDDAIGEAFDKVAKILELPYPGGPPIEKLAKTGNSKAYEFKAAKMKDRPLDFSFSGIKTSVLYTVKGKDLKKAMPPTIAEKSDIAASFQKAVFDDVLEKVKLAVATYPVKAIFLGGGVTQNQELRGRFEQTIGLPLHWPGKELSLDNGAMIAGLGYHKYLENKTTELYSLEPETRIPFAR